MTGHGMTVFATAIGACGIAWGLQGIVAVQLPLGDADKTRTRLKRRCPDANDRPPRPEIARAVADITQLLAGAPRDLGYVILDMNEVPEFNQRVYAVARTIPPGATMTYGEIATRLGDRLLARDVGQALGKNPFPVIVPCHRVLAAGGKSGRIKTGGFSAPGGVTTKLRMLSIERAQPGGPTLFKDLPLAARERR
jgi:methylated-DNA-[protein]-cysteine S-methyltransferase